ncbi:MAG: fasciclin domain-containing protein [Balneolaceae bacterium]
MLFIAALQPANAQDGTVVDVVASSEDHTILAEMLEETELTNVISQPGPYTLIAPTDDAFEELGSELDEIRSNPERMQNVVIGHLFQGEVSAEEAEPALEVSIAEGDIPASNGLVHVVDEVMMNN